MHRVGLSGPGHPKESELNCRKDRLAQVLGVKVRGKGYSKGWGVVLEIRKEISAWWLRPVISAAWRLGQENHKFKGSLDNFESPCLKTLKKG